MTKSKVFTSFFMKTIFIVFATATVQITSAGISAQIAQARSAEDVILETANHYAKVGLTADWAATEPNLCSMFVRQVFQKAFPKNALLLRNQYFGGSAKISEEMWAKQGKLKSYSWIRDRGGLKIGDVVFQDYLNLGHVGVVVDYKGEMMIAENTVRYGYYIGNLRRTDFRALTTLARFGRVKSVGRITGFASVE